MDFKPRFTIDSKTLNLVADIVTMVERVPKEFLRSEGLKIRKINRVKSIHSSLAIDGNSLSQKDVTNISNSKKVAGDPKEILEVKNALSAFGGLDRFDPASAEDLLSAHMTMTAGVAERPGKFRNCEIGFFKDGIPVHIAPDNEDVPDMINELMGWYRDTDLHPLIKGCIFHCRFEYIHPFIEGNGRMSRLWQSLILSKWRPILGHLPVEEYVLKNKRSYNGALSEADKGNVDVFIKFMLTMIKWALEDLIKEASFAPARGADTETSILEMIKSNPRITAAAMADSLNVNERTIKRYLSSMVKRGMVRRVGSDKTGHWGTIDNW